jgi:mono/diheme cytochrome c family protein
LLGLDALAALIQLVPYGRAHGDPSPTQEVRFANADAQRLFDGACADCHSDHTSWPPYSNVAPVSWLVQRDVDEGRSVMNLSEWDKGHPDLGEVEEVILGGGMPPLQYKVAHSRGRLSSAEKRRLAAGFRAIYRSSP